jgi:hypothetical protein
MAALKMKASCSSETLVPIYPTTFYLVPEDRNPNIHQRENLRSRRLLYPIFADPDLSESRLT